jgi:hypothetical protein
MSIANRLKFGDAFERWAFRFTRFGLRRKLAAFNTRSAYLGWRTDRRLQSCRLFQNV